MKNRRRKTSQSNSNNTNSAVKALGPLFNLTLISLWDDNDDDSAYSTHNQHPTLPKHIRFKYDDDDDDDDDEDDDGGAKISPDASVHTTEAVILGEEMTALGLPLSFCTNKHKVGKIKVKSQVAEYKILKSGDKKVEESCKSNEEKPYCADFQLKSSNSSSSSARDQSGHSGRGFNNIQDTVMLPNACERHMPTDMAADLSFYGPEKHANDSSSLNQPAEAVIIDDSVGDDLPMEVEMMYVDGISNLPTANTFSASNILDDHLEDDMSLTGQHSAQVSNASQPENSDFTTIEQPQLSDLSEESQNMAVLDQDYNEASICWGTCGDWSAYWDASYSRYYFYNAETKVSTWNPPPGMESFASGEGCCSAIESNAAGSSRDLSEEVQSVECENSGIQCPALILTQLSNASSSTCAVEATHDDTSELYQDEESYTNVKKYWYQRYLLFSRFDDGIMMDEEGWFSVTPESIARHQALRCGEGIIVDGFTGVGGNAIQFAKTCKHVIAIDIDPHKLEYAYHNATIYGVQDNIDFVLGDSLSIGPKLKADSVFLSPPWGGPNYVKAKPYSLDMLQPYDGKFLFETFKAIAPKIIMFLPRHVDIEQLAELAVSANPPWSLEVEKNFLNGHFKAVTAYFSKTSV